MIASVYARKSTAQKNVPEEAKSVTRQVDGARAFIAAQGWTLAEEHVYIDDGVSGVLFANRDEFQRMMRDARDGAFEAVVFFDLDRFGRNARHTMEAFHKLADFGVTVWDYSTGLAVDIDSLAGETLAFLKARMAQDQQAQTRKHTRDAMRRKAEQGYVTGGKVFGYDNVKQAPGCTDRRINEAEATVVREIYTRFALGEGPRTIALALNNRGVPAIRAQQGRKSGWGPSTIHAVLERPLYRGQLVWGRTISAYGRELGKRAKKGDGKARECGQLPRPEDTWTRRDVPHLRIIDDDLAARCDQRRSERRKRYMESLERGDGRVPQRSHGKYLMSGGMMVCPLCGGHFEARKDPWRKIPGGVYVCSTRRRKPGTCASKLAFPIEETDERMLSLIEGHVLSPEGIESLIALVDRGDGDDTARLTEDRDRLRREINNLLDLVASGVSAETTAPKIRERETEISRIEAKLRTPRPARPDIAKLREALTLRADEWKAKLREEPKIARLLLRQLMGPLVLHEEPTDSKIPKSSEGLWWMPFEAPVKPGLLDGITTQHVASLTGFGTL